MNKKLQTSLSIILDFAEKYAEGDHFDFENFNDCKKIIEKEIKKLQEYKEKYKGLCN